MSCLQQGPGLFSLSLHLYLRFVHFSVVPGSHPICWDSAGSVCMKIFLKSLSWWTWLLWLGELWYLAIRNEKWVHIWSSLMLSVRSMQLRCLAPACHTGSSSPSAHCGVHGALVNALAAIIPYREYFRISDAGSIYICKAARSFRGFCCQGLGSNRENYNFERHFCSSFC